MKAIYFEQTGNAQSVLSIKEVDKPAPKANQVIIKLLGSPINPADFLFIAGSYRFKPEFPQIAGLEGAGIIDSVGDGVDLTVGSLVSFFSKNAWAEYVAVPKEELFVLPPEFPVDKAIQFALNPITAWGLLEQANLQTGDWLVLTAGNSAVSHLIAKIAKQRNINVIATVRNSKYKAALNAIGATAINVTDENLTVRIQQLTNCKGVATVLDAAGGNTGTELLQCLQLNGKFIIYGKLDPAPIQFHNSTIQYKNLSITAFGIRAYLAGKSDKQKAEIVQSLIRIIGDPDFKMAVAATYKLEEYNKAIQTVLENTKEGKVIFKV